MKNILKTLAVLAMASMISVSAFAQKNSGKAFVEIIGEDGVSVVAPIDNKGNATFTNVKPGNYLVGMLLPAVQKIRESAAKASDKGHEKWIEIESWSWGVSSSDVVVAGSNIISSAKAPKKPSPDIFNVVKVLPKTAPLGQLVTRKGYDYYKVQLQDILVSSYQSGGSSSNDRPMESLSLNFTKIEWDIKENKK